VIFAAATAAVHEVVDAVAAARAHLSETRTLLSHHLEHHHKRQSDTLHRLSSEAPSSASLSRDVALVVAAELQGAPPPLPASPPSPRLLFDLVDHQNASSSSHADGEIAS